MRVSAKIVNAIGNPWTHLDLQISVDNVVQRTMQIDLAVARDLIVNDDANHDMYGMFALIEAMYLDTTGTIDGINALIRDEDRA